MILFLMLLAFTLDQPVAPGDWCYDSEYETLVCIVPSEWTWNCPCKRQSPIDIKTDKVIRNSTLTPFQFTNYDKKKKWKLVNNGHTVQVDLDQDIKISGGGMKATYKAVAFHLHWSNSTDKGSEHTIDGNPSAMELHIVHIKDKYNDLSEALTGNNNDEVAVLGFLIKPSDKNHSGFSNLVNGLKNIRYKSYETDLEEFSLSDLIPEAVNLKKYYRYWGSLTTPECDEKVIWTVFHEPIYLHNSQIFEFSDKLCYNPDEEATDLPIIDNFRPTQPLNNRDVFVSGVEILLSQSWPILLAPLLTYLLPVFFY